MAKPVARNPISTKYILSHEKQKVNLFLQNKKKTSGMRIMPNAEFQIPIYRSDECQMPNAKCQIKVCAKRMN